MMRSFFLLGLCALSLPVSAGEGRFDLAGEVAREGAASVPITFDIYRACGPGESRLVRELRVFDSAGTPQPFLVRRRGTFKRTVSMRYVRGEVAGLSENPDGSLTLRARYTPAENADVLKYTELRIDTPLQNFAQFVTVLDDETGERKLGEGRIYGDSRFADIRRTSIRIPEGLPAAFRLVIRKPVAEVEKAEFERTIRKGAGAGESVRRMVSEQAFKIRSIEAGEPVETFRFEESPPVSIVLPGGKVGTGCYSYSAFSAPVVSGEAHVRGSYWAFTLRPLDPAETPPGHRRGHRLARLPSPGKHSTEFPVRPDENDGSIHLFPDFEDAAPADFASPAFTFKQIPQEVVFLAKPGERYHLAFDRSGKPFRFPQEIRSYLENARQTAPLLARQQGEFDAPGETPAAAWFRRHGITALSIASLAVLAFCCLKLFGKAASADGSPRE